MSSMEPLARRDLLKAGVAGLAAAALPELAGGQSGDTRKPHRPDNNGWVIDPRFTDEFNATPLNTNIWTENVPSWGVWSWDPMNTWVSGGELHVQMKYQPHARGGQNLYFTSGIIRSKETITYGHFEARIKCSSRLPGTCPAFWMKGDGPQAGTNCEVDFLELTEHNPTGLISQNTHARVPRPGGGFQDIHESRTWPIPAGFGLQSTYHVFGCTVTRQDIIWYIDGVETARRANAHWHYPMYVQLSLGLRQPFREFDCDMAEGCETLPVNPGGKPSGFDTQFQVNWVRVFRRA